MACGSGQGQNSWYDTALAYDSGHIIPTDQALAVGQSINLHSALS